MSKPTKKKAAKSSKEKVSGAAAKISPRDLASVRKNLLEMRDDLIKTVRNQKIADSEGEVGDAADQASQSSEKEMLFELSDNERATLDQVEAALRKMGKGSYGICESCQNPIRKMRLDALPFARYCMPCQNSAESAPADMDAGRGADD